MNTQHVSIALGERSYSILIGAGLLDCADAFGAAPEVAGNGRALIVSNETVAPLYARRRYLAAMPVCKSWRCLMARLTRIGKR